MIKYCNAKLIVSLGLHNFFYFMVLETNSGFLINDCEDSSKFSILRSQRTILPKAFQMMLSKGRKMKASNTWI